MQITPNDSGAATGQLNSLDLKVSQLITNLANKPLLIEKLVLNQAQGVLLQLVKGDDKLNLQLPLQTANFFKSIASGGNGSQAQTSLSLNITGQQQLRVVLNSQTAQTNNLNPPIISNTTLPSLIFQKANLLPGQIIKLDKLIQAKDQSKMAGATNQPIKSNINQQQNSNSIRNLASGASVEKLQSSVIVQQNPNQNTSSSVGKNSTSNTPITKNLNQTNNINQSNNLKTSDKIQLTDKISVASAAKHLLSQQFPKQLPLSKHINNISQLANSLETIEFPTPAIKKLLQQIKAMFATITKPTKINSGEIKQRIEQSGHKLENNLTYAQKLTSSEEPVSPNKNNQSNLIKQLRQIASGQTSTSIDSASPLIKKDLKLQLMQIRASLESLIASSLKTTSRNASPNAAQVQSGAAPEAAVTDRAAVSTSNPQSTERQLSNPLLQRGNRDQNQKISLNQRLLNQQSFVFKQASELLTEVKNIISQIETNQLLSLKNDQPNLHQFLVDLPFGKGSEIDSFELLFEHSNDENNNKATKSWKIVVRFDLEPLGPMFAQVELINDRLSTHIFAQSQQTAKLIDENLHVLKQSLFSAGIDTQQVTGSQGNIPEKLLLDNERKIDTHV